MHVLVIHIWLSLLSKAEKELEQPLRDYRDTNYTCVICIHVYCFKAGRGGRGLHRCPFDKTIL